MTPSRPTPPVDFPLPRGAAPIDTRIDVQRLTAADAHWHHDALADLLREVVDEGACVGFLAPLSREDAARHWIERQPGLAHDHGLWIARCGDRVFGAVRLQGGLTADAAHRAEVSCLIVHPTARRRGIATALMAVLERHAFDMGHGLLVLDVDSDSVAALAFSRRGWCATGPIPGYATSPHGALRSFTRFYKTLAPAPH